jgi:hypothetical protein
MLEGRIEGQKRAVIERVTAGGVSVPGSIGLLP